MSNTLTNESIQCPYCGEYLEILIDHSVINQTYIEDCQVCCCPIEIGVEIDGLEEMVRLTVKRDNE